MEWENIEYDEELKENLLKLLISIISFEKDGFAELIGTGFIIHACKNTALVMTAAHNFLHLKQLQNPYEIHHHTALPEFVSKIPHSFSLDRKLVRALFLNKNDFDACIIKGVSVIEEIDVALCSLELQNDHGRELFDSKFGIDTSPPNIGDEILVIGFSNMKILNQHISGEYREQTVERSLEIRKGLVTSVLHKGDRHLKWPFFETNIPVTPGMSGGIALKMPKYGEPMNACGVISTDFSSEEAFNNCDIAGQSTMAMLWPAVLLPFNAVIDSNESISSNLLDLISKGLIDDNGRASERTKIIVNDNNTTTINRSDIK